MALPGLLIVEERVTQLTLDELLWWSCPLLLTMIGLKMFLKVELDHVLLATELTIVD